MQKSNKDCFDVVKWQSRQRQYMYNCTCRQRINFSWNTSSTSRDEFIFTTSVLWYCVRYVSFCLRNVTNRFKNYSFANKPHIYWGHIQDFSKRKTLQFRALCLNKKSITAHSPSLKTGYLKISSLIKKLLQSLFRSADKIHVLCSCLRA